MFPKNDTSQGFERCLDKTGKREAKSSSTESTRQGPICEVSSVPIAVDKVAVSDGM